MRDFQNLHKGIKKEIGAEAATEFVQMMADASGSNATDFLHCLYKLEQNNWKWSARLMVKLPFAAPGKRPDGLWAINEFLNTHKGEYIDKISAHFARMRDHILEGYECNKKLEGYGILSDMDTRMLEKEICHQFGKAAWDEFSNKKIIVAQPKDGGQPLELSYNELAANPDI